MDSKQIETAMKTRSPVIYNGNRYKRILLCVSWYDAFGNRQLCAVLLAEQGNWFMKVPADMVEEA